MLRRQHPALRRVLALSKSSKNFACCAEVLAPPSSSVRCGKAPSFIDEKTKAQKYWMTCSSWNQQVPEPGFGSRTLLCCAVPYPLFPALCIKSQAEHWGPGDWGAVMGACGGKPLVICEEPLFG